MSDGASKILVTELGKLGGIGARIAARFLPDVPYECVFDVAASPDDVGAAAAAVLAEIGTTRPELPENSVVCGSGRFNLNPTIASVTVRPSASGASIKVHAVAKEGLSKQDSAKKAVERITPLLRERTGLTNRSS
jgi:hypothetical protein